MRLITEVRRRRSKEKRKIKLSTDYVAWTFPEEFPKYLEISFQSTVKAVKASELPIPRA